MKYSLNTSRSMNELLFYILAINRLFHIVNLGFLKRAEAILEKYGLIPWSSHTEALGWEGVR